MQRTGKHLAALVASALALVALAAVLASPAMASEVKAKFSASTIKLTTAGITLKKNGGEATTCTLRGGSAAGPIGEENSLFIAGNDTWGTLGEFNCTGGKAMSMTLTGRARYDTVASRYFIRFLQTPSCLCISPWGGYSQKTEASTGFTWTNGSGSTQSTISFNEELLGTLNSGGTLTISGSFTATTSGNSLLTLSH